MKLTMNDFKRLINSPEEIEDRLRKRGYDDEDDEWDDEEDEDEERDDEDDEDEEWDDEEDEEDFDPPKNFNDEFDRNR